MKHFIGAFVIAICIIPCNSSSTKDAAVVLRVTNLLSFLKDVDKDQFIADKNK